MKPLGLFLGMSIILVIGCITKDKFEYTENQIEIPLLKTNEEKRRYLEKIFDNDQSVRGSRDQEILVKFGKDSDEYRKYIQSVISQDSINLVKIERYLAKFGHPDKAEVGELAAQTPWAVIHHAHSYEARERNFEFLYTGYLEGNIDDGALTKFLGRMYRIKNGDRLILENPYTSEEEIKLLIKALQLDKIKERVLSKESKDNQP